MDSSLTPYRYQWPLTDLAKNPSWQPISVPSLWQDGTSVEYFVRQLPETRAELANDSRWPAFFPAPMCLVTAADGVKVSLEKVVGASIVNRFPYVMALSFCREPLSKRHHVRRSFMDCLEAGEAVAVQFLPPGPELDRAMGSVLKIADASQRILAAGLPTRRARTNSCPVFTDAYLAYEARLVKPSADFGGAGIYQTPWLDLGSHRVYFLEINAIQLRRDIALGQTQVRWRSLPSWHDDAANPLPAPIRGLSELAYSKGFMSDYAFPSANTVAFEADELVGDMAVKQLPPLAQDQVEVDNDRARWPCFFPSSAGMITTWAPDGRPNVMPCGSTTILSRHPLIIAPCISYAAINQRYAPRVSLDILRRTGRFGCGVPYGAEQILRAIRYAGNVSLAKDSDKTRNSGLSVAHLKTAPILADLPVHFDCRVTGEVRLGTHVMFLGEVERILVRANLTPRNPLDWCPWASVSTIASATGKARCA